MNEKNLITNYDSGLVPYRFHAGGKKWHFPPKEEKTTFQTIETQ